jgi:hypothetical protein
LSEGATLGALGEQAAFRDYLGKLIEHIPATGQ